MRCDAEWLAQMLVWQQADALSPVLNLGSSTRHFREVEQPHIDRVVFAPLRLRGIKVIHSDLKDEDGVDIAGDIFDPETLARIRALGPKAVICTHMLEHVEDCERLARTIVDILPAGGLFFVTV